MIISGCRFCVCSYNKIFDILWKISKENFIGNFPIFLSRQCFHKAVMRLNNFASVTQDVWVQRRASVILPTQFKWLK